MPVVASTPRVEFYSIGDEAQHECQKRSRLSLDGTVFVGKPLSTTRRRSLRHTELEFEGRSRRTRVTGQPRRSVFAVSIRSIKEMMNARWSSKARQPEQRTQK